MKFVFSLLGILAYFNYIHAQNQAPQLFYPEVGKPCPDFVLQNIKYFPKKEARLKDFRGKWLLLDFWSKNCGACIASFPHLNKMQKELGNKVLVMMVGIEDPEKKIELIYSRYRAKENLIMPCAFDSLSARRFDYGNVTPRSVLIDDKGIVQCLTSTIHLDEMRAFLAGDHPVLHKSYRMSEDDPEDDNHIIPFDIKKPFAINGNGADDKDFLFRSILTSWKPDINRVLDEGTLFGNTLWINPRSFCLMGVPLPTLYL